MRITVASGKGGAGKTTLATALAVTAAERRWHAAYADCDVEAPNGHLLLAPAVDDRTEVTRPIPSVDAKLCGLCGACEQACQFGAIVCLGRAVQVHPTLCKSCGACVAACPHQAIAEVAAPVGRIETGRAGSLQFVHGFLDIGQARSIPVIEAVQGAIDPSAEVVVIDSPPGTACPMMAALRGSDVVLLVAESTAFGLADLTVAADAIAAAGLPAAVVINHSDLGDDRVDRHCAARGLAVIGRIPHSVALAQGYAAGDAGAILAALGAVPGEVLDRLMQMPARRAS